MIMTPSSGFYAKQRPGSLFRWEMWTEMTLEELKNCKHEIVEQEAFYHL